MYDPTAPSQLSDAEWEELHRPLTQEAALHTRDSLHPDWLDHRALCSQRSATVGRAGYFPRIWYHTNTFD